MAILAVGFGMGEGCLWRSTYLGVEESTGSGG